MKDHFSTPLAGAVLLESPAMDVSWILDDLNEPQRQAVTAPLGSLRVLAGAGSGKTRVLTRRIAWLLAMENASPWSILAVTFTNKAAAEMRGRVEAMLDQPIGGLWIGTFHGIAHRLLRQHWQEARLPRGFQILDSDDQNRLLKRVLRGLNLDEKKWPPPQVAGFVNRCKDEGQRPADLADDGKPVQRQYRQIYGIYQQECERGGLVDFGELLLRVYELWRDNPDLLSHYRERFQHVLVDEFQDTNAIQYNWVRLLGGGRSDVFIVGDDDQCVYGWRGSKVENIQRFADDFPGTQTIRLEQNYRSTHNILKAANALIAHNAARLGKNLWTADGDGDPIQVYNAFNEVDEARFVAERIRQWAERGGRRGDVAILYRSNAQSRLFEETLIGMAIPYRIYGGLRFFERAEIKLLRARRNQGCPGLSAPARQPRRRSFVRASGQYPAARHRRPDARSLARNVSRPGWFALANRLATAGARRAKRPGSQRRARVSQLDRDAGPRQSRPPIARTGGAYRRSQRPAGDVRAVENGQGRNAGREPGGVGQRQQRFRYQHRSGRGRPIRSWSAPTRTSRTGSMPSSPMPRWNPVEGKGRPATTAYN